MYTLSAPSFIQPQVIMIRYGESIVWIVVEVTPPDAIEVPMPSGRLLAKLKYT
jgi:hypothetical protein